MARVHPPLDQIRPTSSGEYAERAVLTALSQGLDARFHLFHSTHWAVADGAGDRHGELDIVVVNDAGDVALLEVKAGSLDQDGEALFKGYGSGSKDVIQQAQRQFGNVLHRLKQERLDVRLLHLLVLPDQRIGEAGTLTYPRERIADSANCGTDCTSLPDYVLARLTSGQPDPNRKERVLAFFANRLPQQPDVSATSGILRRQVSELSDGLATWVPRITAPRGVIRVQGTAGSGKTQLALKLLRKACVASQSAAYVCFNRPLADQMRRHAPDRAEVTTFHQLAWLAAGSPTGSQDHAAHVLALEAAREGQDGDLDLLVIDEVQDLMPNWVDLLSKRLKNQGRLYLLDDPGQCLYDDREEFDIADSVLITCDDNHRSPRRIVETINLLGLSDRPIQSRSPFVGQAPNIIEFDPQAADKKSDSLVSRTIQAVQNCLDQGFALQDIVVLCWRGLGNSKLMKLERLGDWPLTRFTGQYGADGEPVWTDGELRIETIRRFKGQSAPAVVLTEVDFDQLTTQRRRMLFVGLTRAQMHVEWLVGASAQQALAQSVGAVAR